MTFSANLGLDYVQAAQAQKHITMNEALSKLDVLVMPVVLDLDFTNSPASPNEGDSYVVASPAGGSWATHENDIASYLNGSWIFYTPRAGWRVYVLDEDTPYDFDGTDWVIKSITAAALSNGTLLELGVNTGSTPTNRLSVKSDNVLFSHDDVTPGTGNMNVTINKDSVGDNASVTYQNGFSGRTIVGLLANDDYTVRVSPNGSTFNDAFVVDSGTAKTDFKVLPSVNGDDVWHAGNVGIGSGLNADLLDGDHGSAFAKLTGATFTGGVTAAGFTGPGGGLTGVNAAFLGGQSAASYARLSGATFTGGVTATGFTGDGSTLTNVDAAFLGGQSPGSYARLSGATFTGTVNAAVVQVNGTAVWHPGNDGPTSGLNADLLDGDHGSAFAKLTGATFTGGVTAAGFTGPGGGLTGVNAAFLGGQSAASYARLSGATFTGGVTATGFTGPGGGLTGVNADTLNNIAASNYLRTAMPISVSSIYVTHADNAISWEHGVNWINGNDGGGNAQIRFGHNHGPANGGGEAQVFTHGGTAFYIGGNLDNVGGSLSLKVASNGGAGVGEIVSWGTELNIAASNLKWGSGDIFHEGNFATGSDQRIFGRLGVNGGTPDANNQFAFFGTNLLLNSSGSINMKYNKNAAGDDASMTFQSGFTTHALLGLLGNNDLTLKVGTGFTTAMTAKGSDGTVSFPEGVKNEAVVAYKTSTQTLTNSWAKITGYDGTHIAASGNLSWSNANGESYVGKAGRFHISYSVSTEISSGASRTDSLARLEKWNGSTWSEVAGTTHRMYNRIAGRGGTAASATVVLDLTASDGLRVAVRRETGTDTVIVDQACLSILRL